MLYNPFGYCALFKINRDRVSWWHWSRCRKLWMRQGRNQGFLRFDLADREDIVRDRNYFV